MATGSPHCGRQSVPLCPWPLHLVSFPPSLLVRVDRSGRPVAAPAFPQRRSLPRGGRRIRLLLRGKLQERSKHSDRAPAYRGRKSEVGVPAVAVAEARCGCTSLPSECSEAGICLQGKKKAIFSPFFLENTLGGSTSVLWGLSMAWWSMGWTLHGGPRRRAGLGCGACGAVSLTC